MLIFLTILKLVLHRLHTLIVETRTKSAYANNYIHQYNILSSNFIPYECNIIALKKKLSVYTCVAIVYALDSKYHKPKGMNIQPLGQDFIDVENNLYGV